MTRKKYKEQILEQMFESYWDKLRENSLFYDDPERREYNVLRKEPIKIQNLLLADLMIYRVKFLKKLEDIVIPKNLDTALEEQLKETIKAAFLKPLGFFASPFTEPNSLSGNFLTYIASDKKRFLKTLEIIKNPLEKRRFFDTVLRKSTLIKEDEETQNNFLNTLEEVKQEDIKDIFRFFPKREAISVEKEDYFFDKKIELLFRFKNKNEVVKLIQHLYDNAPVLEKIFIANFKNKSSKNIELLQDLKIENDIQFDQHDTRIRCSSIMELFQKNEAYETSEERVAIINFQNVLKTFNNAINDQILKSLVDKINFNIKIEEKYGLQEISFRMNTDMTNIVLKTTLKAKNRRISEDEVDMAEEAVKRTSIWFMNQNILTSVSSQVEMVRVYPEEVKNKYIEFLKEIRSEIMFKTLNKNEIDSNVRKKSRGISKI